MSYTVNTHVDIGAVIAAHKVFAVPAMACNPALPPAPPADVLGGYNTVGLLFAATDDLTGKIVGTALANASGEVLWLTLSQLNATLIGAALLDAILASTGNSPFGDVVSPVVRAAVLALPGLQRATGPKSGANTLVWRSATGGVIT